MLKQCFQFNNSVKTDNIMEQKKERLHIDVKFIKNFREKLRLAKERHQFTFSSRKKFKWIAAILLWIGLLLLKPIFWPEHFTVRNMKIGFSEKNSRCFRLVSSWIFLISCSICGLEFDMGKISSINTSLDPCWITFSKKGDICWVARFGRPLTPCNFPSNEKKKLPARWNSSKTNGFTMQSSLCIRLHKIK